MRAARPLDDETVRTVAGAVPVAAQARGAAPVAIVDGLGHVRAAVPALVVRAGRRHDQLALPLLDQRVANVPAGERRDRHPHGPVPRELAARPQRRARCCCCCCRALAQPPFEARAVGRAHDDPELGRAGVQEAQRVQQAVLDVQRKRRRRGAGVHVQVRRVDAGRRRSLLGKAAVGPADERRLANAEATADGGGCLKK